MQSPQKRANGRFKAMIHQILTVEPDADVGAQSPDIEYFVKKIDGGIVLKDILTHGVMTWPDLLRCHSTFVRESARRAAERMERQSTPLERLRGDAFSGGRSSIKERRAKHRYWKAAMKAAQLLYLGKEVACFTICGIIAGTKNRNPPELYRPGALKARTLRACAAASSGARLCMGPKRPT